MYAYVGGTPLKYSDVRGLDNPGMGPYDPPAGWVNPSSPYLSYRPIVRKSNCKCTLASGATVENVVLETVLPSGGAFSAGGGVAGSVAGGYYATAVEGVHLARKGYQITRILVLADSVFSGMVAGGVVGGAAGLVLGAGVAAIELLPARDCICVEQDYCKPLR